MFRHSKADDIPAMVKIAEDAKALLKSQGISQWQRGNYPSEELFAKDVKDGIGYVLEDENALSAICAVTFTDEAAYRGLKGQWLTPDEAIYATIHRGAVAANCHGKGVALKLLDEVKKMAKERGAVSIRVDTHPGNIAMQKTFEKAGFTRCGELILLDGDEAGDLRYGYELVIS